MRYKITISYDGTDFAGWQVQKNAQAIQPIIQKEIEKILTHPIDLTGSSRTDANVHALGQTAHFDSEVVIDPYRFLFSINKLLPKQIRIYSIEKVEPTFHARYSAKGKIYHYHIYTDSPLNPFVRNFRHQILGSFDLAKVISAAKSFVRRADFTSFANVKKPAPEDPVRTISRLDVVEQEGGFRLEFEGDGFLYKMVRNIVGYLIEVGQNKRSIDELDAILAAKDRKKAGHTAPAQALFLVKVLY